MILELRYPRILIAAIVSFVACSPMLAQDPAGLAGRWFYIHSQHSTYDLADCNPKTEAIDGLTVRFVCQDKPKPDQVWEFIHDGKGYVYIRSRQSGLYLDVYMGKKDVGARVCQAEKNQVWQLIHAEVGGFYYIKNMATNLFLDACVPKIGGNVCGAAKHPLQIWALVEEKDQVIDNSSSR